MRRRRKRKGHYHRGTHQSPKAGECKYRSGWELSYMLHLDADPAVQSYLYEGLAIDYVSNVRSGRQRKYYPDFLVTYAAGHRHLVEIKPSKRLAQVRVQKKLAAAEEWCRVNGATFVVLTERELKPMGLVK